MMNFLLKKDLNQMSSAVKLIGCEGVEQLCMFDSRKIANTALLFTPVWTRNAMCY